MASKGSRRSLRSRKGNTSSLASLPEDEVPVFKNQSSRPSPAYNPGLDAQRQPNVTPKKRKRKMESSIAEKQKRLARDADPHNGHCLITNRRVAVQTCHLVARATDDTTITQLEYAWGTPYHELHVDTRYNLIFLRADWHITFDASPPMWMLIPMIKDLQKLNALTLGKSRNPAKLRQVFKSGRQYEYRLLPLANMEEPICRYPDADNNENYVHHVRPYKDLGPLLSHVRPQYVVVNTAQKLEGLTFAEIRSLARILAEISSVPYSKALSIISLITDMYSAWIELSIEPKFIHADAAPRRPESDNDEDNDEDGEGDHSQGEGSQSGTDPDLYDDEESGDEEGAESPTRSGRGQTRDVADLRSEDSTDSCVSECSVGSLQSLSDVSTYNTIVDWMQECEAKSESDWDRISDQKDVQGAQYAKEPTRRVPSVDYWKKWKPYWRSNGNDIDDYFDTSQFSSNDWAARECDTFLPRFLGRCR